MVTRNAKLKVLVVDDSRIFRLTIEQILRRTDDIEVVGSVRNGVEAIEFIRKNRPDLVTLDVKMPEMDGLQALEIIQRINTASSEDDVGVLMVSAFTRRGADVTIEALEAGAFDFILKPYSNDFDKNIADLRNQLLVKIRAFSVAKRLTALRRVDSSARVTGRSKPITRPITERGNRTRSIVAIGIGVSTGGPKALSDILPELSDTVALPIFIVQHMPSTFTRSLAESLDKKCSHTVVECIDKMVVHNCHVYIAPGGKHMTLKKNYNGAVELHVNTKPAENGCRPSVDVLFRSAVDVYGSRILPVVLTGMGRDGTEGLKPLKESGAYVVAQDEETSVVWGMPGSAVNAGLVDSVLPLDAIPKAIGAMV